MTPGRVGTSSPELGVPVTFADISAVSGICEVSDSRAGYMPETELRKPYVQDMVEAEIFYSALWEDRRKLAYDPELFAEEENLFPTDLSGYGGTFPHVPGYPTGRPLLLERCYVRGDSLPNCRKLGLKNNQISYILYC